MRNYSVKLFLCCIPLIFSSFLFAKENSKYQLVNDEPATPDDGFIKERAVIIQDWNIRKGQDIAAKKKQKSDASATSGEPQVEPVPEEGNKKKEASAFIKILPFGAGQFAHGRPALGTMFAVGQLTSLILLYTDLQEQSKVEKEGLQYIDDREAELKEMIAANASASEQDAHNTETDEKAAEYRKKISDLSSKATIYGALLGIFYFSSVIEAFVRGPVGADASSDKPADGVVPGKKKKKKKKKGTYVLPDGEEIYGSNYPGSHFDWQVSPIPFNSRITPEKPSVNLQISYSF